MRPLPIGSTKCICCRGGKHIKKNSIELKKKRKHTGEHNDKNIHY